MPSAIVPPEPSLWNVLAEGRAVSLEVPRLLWSVPDLASEPRGAGEPVVVFPGYGASDVSTVPLRAFLRLLGWSARGWGLGVNRGDVAELVPRVTRITERLADASGQPVRVVGWSLGGVLAREVARERPDAVARVITLGSPVVGGPKYTAVGRIYARRGYDLDAIEAAVEARNRIPIHAPITAVYSRNDRVVAWEACIDRHSADVEHVEVTTSHVGLGISAEVYRIVARRLAGRLH